MKRVRVKDSVTLKAVMRRVKDNASGAKETKKLLGMILGKR